MNRIYDDSEVEEQSQMTAKAEIPIQVNYLENEIGFLNNTVVLLSTILNPILLPQDDIERNYIEESKTLLGKEIEGYVFGVSQINSQIKNIISRLALTKEYNE